MTTPICPRCKCNADIVWYLEQEEDYITGLYQCLDCNKVFVWQRSFTVPPKVSEPRMCIRCGEKEGYIGGYCPECNEIASEKRRKLREEGTILRTRDSLPRKEKHCFKQFATHGSHSGECIYSPCYQECYEHHLMTVGVKQ